MNRLETSKLNVERIIQDNRKMNFPEFISKLREALCISRQVVADDLNIHYLKLFYMEIGGFRKALDPELIDRLADYFGVYREIMRKKAADFVGKGTCQRGRARRHT